MRREPDTQPDSPAAVADEVSPRSPWRVARVEALPGHRLRVVFLDGLTGTVDLARLVHSPHAGVFAALMDEALFAQVHLEHGAVAWPGELDLAPDVMYDSIREHGEWRL
ncbi:MAG TPA: DUF2442 domain-containing protein [Terracidiphilus sp.]|nr:DUF2442 domain-containing protein [Terracidiphilus sp.]